MSRPHPSPIIHQLPEYAADGYSPSYEYSLPVELPPTILASLDPWIRKVACLAPGDVLDRLQVRWSTLRNEALCQLRDYLLESDITSLVLQDSCAWLLSVNESGGFTLIGPPTDLNRIHAQLPPWRLDHHSPLAEFVSNFGGLREDFAPGGGWFIDDHNWEGVNQSWMKDIEGFSDWEGSLILFTSRGGDLLLMHHTGRIGWWVSDEVRMKDAYDDFDSAIIDFVRYQKAAWPFDPYEPRPNFPA
jgi:hypothetical protein